jgi:hypothetical protein
MSKESESVEEILEDLKLGIESTEGNPSSSPEDGASQDLADTSPNRLEKLVEAGAITQEEYEVLQSHGDQQGAGNSNKDSNSISFGEPITTSEGSALDISILGIIEDVDTSPISRPDYLDQIDEDEVPSDFEGGPGRTLAFWLLHNKSDEEVKLRNKYFEMIGEDQIAYKQSENPIHEDKLQPGWRAGNKVYLSPDTRAKFACGAEIPVSTDEVRISGKYIDDHSISVKEDMRFPESELPVAVDL